MRYQAGCRVTRDAQAARRVWVRPGAGALVGRDRELAALTTAVKWSPALVLVEGPAGVGTSRLVTELVRRTGGQGWVAVGRCDPPRARIPFGVVVDVLSRYPHRLAGVGAVAGALRAHLPELADRLPPEPPGAAHRLVEGFGAVLAALGRATLVLEDAHWADAHTVDLVRHLLADPPPGLTLVVTGRPLGPIALLAQQSRPLQSAARRSRGMAVTRLVVEPLDVAGVRELVVALTGVEAVSAEFAEALWRQTAGLPAVVVEVVGALCDPVSALGSGRDASARLFAELHVPWSVREELAERLSGLAEPARALLRAAAVLGSPAPAALLSTVAGGADVALLAHEHVLDEHDGRYGFRHPLARRAVYESLPGAERRRLHTRALRALAAEPATSATCLARHAKAAGAVGDWLRYGELAADEAMAAGRDGTAIALVSELITEESIAADDVARLVTALCRYALDGTRHDEVIAVLERRYADPRLTEEVRAEVSIGLGLLLIRAPGDLVRSDMKIRTSMGTPGVAQAWSMRGIAILGMPYLGDRSIEECRRWQGLLAARIRRMPAGAARTALLASTLQSRLAIGDPEVEDMIGLLPHRVDPAEAEHARQLARAWCNLADVCSWLGHYGRARRLLRHGLRGAAAAAAPYVTSTGLGTEIHLDWLAGRCAGLDQRAEALIAANPGALPVFGEMRLVQGWLATIQGDWQRAEDCFRATRMREPESAMAPVALAAVGGMVALHLDRGDVRAACTQADAGVAMLRHQRVWAWAGDLLPAAVEAYVSAGALAKARVLVDEATKGIAEVDAPYLDAALSAARAHLAVESPVAAARLYEAAAERYRELGVPYAAARLAERAAELDPTRAVAFLGLAKVYERVGAVIAAARCRHRVRRTGGAVPSTRGRRGYGGTLSPREIDIARLLAGGHTNREIAETLFLSRRTVEDHVANVLRKLGVGSRGELVR
ncbi:LuxR family transcriptional regulator [Actinokineospora sp. NBRC 105648]|uniref:ATP-binding protein n=1 Tax=Actinokineospora sp. NBRC 105648 TaxID=3032206 RepID=UPI0024A443EF|nr:LuxR family transcriptional regulator [Actinokineospora sp. NBRC 105648]GLZ40052.1 LuxR family transcriptional regulator [Actinokineospora sp. NBRC 105648]